MKSTPQQLEFHLWDAANILRDKTAGKDYKDYVLSLMFYKRLCDQREWEVEVAIAKQEPLQGRAFTEDQKAVFREFGEHRYDILDGSEWKSVKSVSANIGETLTQAINAVANANEELWGVFTVDWNQPASYWDYTFILHILSSLTDNGRAGVVCLHGVLFRSQPKTEEESDELDAEGNPTVKRRKADDEHLIWKVLLQSRLIDAIISLPFNVFYGAGISACLFILRKRLNHHQAKLTVSLDSIV